MEMENEQQAGQTNLAEEGEESRSNGNSYVSSVAVTETSTGEFKMKKYPLSFRKHNVGNILTIHHTVKEEGKLIRIVFNTYCFNLRGTQLVAIDRRGNIFIIDFANKRFWRHPKRIEKSSVVVPSVKRFEQYLVGTKTGFLILLDVEKKNLMLLNISQDPISEISFAGVPLQPKNLAVIRSGNAAYLVNLKTFTCTHRLDFDKRLMALKFAFYLPYSEHILTCFTNDSVHIWSSIQLEVLRIINPIKLRDRKLQLQTSKDTTPVLELNSDNVTEFPFGCDHDLTEGLILSYCYQTDGSCLCFSTLDNYLLLLSPYTFELLSVFKLKNFLLQQCALMPKPNENLILGLTDKRKVILLDCANIEFKLIVDMEVSRSVQLSTDGKLLAISKCSGEMSIWSVSYLINVLRSQERCMDILRAAFKQNKPMPVPTATNAVECRFREELRKLLTPQRLQQILQEYHCYPSKYRALIWSCLLRLPNNRAQYQDLMQTGLPKIIVMKSRSYELKNSKVKRALIRCWSNLAQWCKMFAYDNAMPSLIFPFVKMFHSNPLATFEVCVTLIFNQFQMFFEYHPLEPSNYLGLCTNILKHFDSPLYKFYKDKETTASIYAWSLLKTSFSEVLDEDQWFCLWDNIISAPPYFLPFCVVAYNIMQREVIVRLPDNRIINNFFHEQNPIDVKKLTSKAFKLMSCCPMSLHPKRYMRNFQPLPQGVYPKFLNYPLKSLNLFEKKAVNIQKLQNSLDDKMRALELEEMELTRKLENGLRREEHDKRLKDIEKYYQDTLKREEERISYQRKMLLLHQKEIRQQKSEVLRVLRESDERKTLLQREHELESLKNNIEKERLRSDIDLMEVEERIRDRELELLAQKTQPTEEMKQPLSKRFHDDIRRLWEEQKLLDDDLKKLSSIDLKNTKKVASIPSDYLNAMNDRLQKYKKEFTNIIKDNHNPNSLK
uniref:Rab-GAP TBC domain-containing protein n=1 Tax=Glossina brevipalpis TaxID=37001 RepID=A0A1A9WQS8_9MUSC